MPRSLRRLARRATDRVAGPMMAELIGRLDALQATVDRLQGELAESRAELIETHSELAALHRDLGARAAELGDGLERNGEMLRYVYHRDGEQRRRLYALRQSEEYEPAFTEKDPLVTFVIPTYTRNETLCNVALPSILDQTYPNLEVVVAGDGSPPEVAEAIAALGDSRVRFHNRSVRGPYPADESVRWFMIATPPYNDGVALARGRWIATLGDDDAVRPDHTETLIRAAQEHRHEHCYGRHVVHYPEGEPLELGVFPPEEGQFILQASIYHSGLRFFQSEPADYLYREANDWSLCRRMLEAGVSFGMVDEILVDKYESRYRSHDDWGTFGIPRVE